MLGGERPSSLSWSRGVGFCCRAMRKPVSWTVQAPTMPYPFTRVMPQRSCGYQPLLKAVKKAGRDNLPVIRASSFANRRRACGRAKRRGENMPTPSTSLALLCSLARRHMHQLSPGGARFSLALEVLSKQTDSV